MNRVAVDLTAMLPGGANGGAKIFTLALLDRLAALRPETQWILLTQAASHDELAALDRANVSRQLVIAPAASARRVGLSRALEAFTSRLPSMVARAMAGFAASTHRAAMRRAGRPVMDRLQPDLLFCPFTATHFRKPGVPAVSVVYDLQHRAFPANFTAAERAVRERALRDALAHADRVVAISHFAAREIEATGLASPGQVRVIPLRMASRFPRVARDDTAIRALGLASGRYFLYPANGWPHKNHLRLLEAFAEARAHGLAADFRLVLTGEGLAAPPFEAAIERLGLAPAVARPGFIPTSEFGALLAAARALVFPSRYEGFGLPVLEAMAAGVPVACSRGTALDEVAGDAAMLFDPDDGHAIAEAMRVLASDDAACAALVARGRARVAEYEDADRMARDYLALFDEACGP